MYIFPVLRNKGFKIFHPSEILLGKITTQSGLIPNALNRQGKWELFYGGDFNFYKFIQGKAKDIKWIDHPIYHKNDSKYPGYQKRNEMESKSDKSSPASSHLPKLEYQHSYKFSSDWFTGNIPYWKQYVFPRINEKNEKICKYLEIGSYEGRSIFFLVDNFPNLEATVIDPFERIVNIAGSKIPLWKRFQENLEISQAKDRISVLKKYSGQILPQLIVEGKKFDIIYIDGSHFARNVLEDAVLSWLLLERGGHLIFDDHGFSSKNPMMKPAMAIDPFLSCYKEEINLVHKGYQVIIEKKNTA